jgi:hypothetical protein
VQSSKDVDFAAKAAELPPGTKANSGVGEMTIQAVDRLSPF